MSLLDHARRAKGFASLQWQRRLRRTPLVDFIIIGAEKAGSTLLQDILRGTPGVSMPESENRYFRDPFFRDANHLGDAIRNFPSNDLIGIKHPSYLAVENVPERLFQYNPKLRLIASLRDPVDRAISSYYHYLSLGQISLRDPDETFDRILSGNFDSQDPKYRDILSFGCYHRHLQRYLEFFPREQIFVCEYERLGTDHQLWEQLFAFLNIQASPPDVIPKRNAGCYQWRRCVTRHFFHRLTSRFDDSMNVLGRHEDRLHVAEAAAEWLESHFDTIAGMQRPVTVSDDILKRLVDVYRDDVQRLIDSDWLRPQHWRYFPSS